MKERPMHSLLLVIFLFSISQILVNPVHSDHEHDEPITTMRLDLLRRHGFGLETQVKHHNIKELFHGDMTRQRMITHKRRGLTSIEMEVYAGRDYGAGEYFASMKVGTPSQRLTLIVDTGSDLTWLNCRYRCGENCSRKGRVGRRRVFKADFSSSFKTVPCLSQMCKVGLMNLFSLTLCPTPLSPCAYDFRYLDGSAALGFFANETVTLGLTNGRKTRLHNVLIGCSDSFRGQSFEQADGVLGLAYSKFSFVNKVTQEFKGKFSYCLVDHLSHKNVSSYLTFGDITNRNQSPLFGNMRYTKLELGLLSPFYAVNIMGISIGGVMLNIPIDVWDPTRGGGTIIDSGSSLTFLTEPAYQAVMATLKMSLTRFERMKLDGVPMEYCFNSTGFDESEVPRLAFHFVDGARFEPHLKSYVIDAADGIKCLGFVSASWPGTSVIGNIMQQNYLWEFDLMRTTLGFAPSTCN